MLIFYIYLSVDSSIKNERWVCISKYCARLLLHSIGNYEIQRPCHLFTKTVPLRGSDSSATETIFLNNFFFTNFIFWITLQCKFSKIIKNTFFQYNTNFYLRVIHVAIASTRTIATLRLKILQSPLTYY